MGFWIVTKAMLALVGNIFPSLFTGRLFRSAASRDSLGAWGIVAGAAMIALALVWWEPFKHRPQKGMMSVRECGATLSDVRSDTLAKALAEQRDIEARAEERRMVLLEQARASDIRSKELEALLSKAEQSGQLGLSADVIRAWNNRGITR